MRKSTQQTLDNIEKYLRKERNAFWGPLQGRVPGFYSRFVTEQRGFFVHYIAKEGIDRLFIDVFPQCVCEPKYRQAVNAYLNSKTSTLNSGRIDLNPDNGEINVRVETVMLDQAPSVAAIEDMEMLALRLADRFCRKIDRLCHGAEFDDEDPELMSAPDRKRYEEEQRKKNASAKKKDAEDEDEEDDEDDVASDAEETSTEDLLEQLRRLAESVSGESDDASDGDEDESDDSDDSDGDEDDSDGDGEDGTSLPDDFEAFLERLRREIEEDEAAEAAEEAEATAEAETNAEEPVNESADESSDTPVNEAEDGEAPAEKPKRARKPRKSGDGEDGNA